MRNHRGVRLPTIGQCTVAGCLRPDRVRGWCAMHYKRWLAHGNPLITYPDKPLMDRLANKMLVDSGGQCWPWVGAKNSRGYGQVTLPGHRTASLAHRVVYEWLVSPIPEGLEIDHLCCNRLCVRPDHLEPVTHRENLARGHERRKGQANEPV